MTNHLDELENGYWIYSYWNSMAIFALLHPLAFGILSL